LVHQGQLQVQLHLLGWLVTRIIEKSPQLAKWDTKGDDGEVYQNGGPESKCSHPVNPLSCTNVLQYLLAEVWQYQSSTDTDWNAAMQSTDSQQEHSSTKGATIMAHITCHLSI
jgi:hypothetical protein